MLRHFCASSKVTRTFPGSPLFSAGVDRPQADQIAVPRLHARVISLPGFVPVQLRAEKRFVVLRVGNGFRVPAESFEFFPAPFRNCARQRRILVIGKVVERRWKRPILRPGRSWGRTGSSARSPRQSSRVQSRRSPAGVRPRRDFPPGRGSECSRGSDAATGFAAAFRARAFCAPNRAAVHKRLLDALWPAGPANRNRRSTPRAGLDSKPKRAHGENRRSIAHRVRIRPPRAPSRCGDRSNRSRQSGPCAGPAIASSVRVSMASCSRK